MPPRLVRKKPLLERIRAKLNVMDFLLWLSEELETRDWDSTLAGTQMGLVLNFIFLLARANSGYSSPSDDVFSDDADSGWLSFFVHPLVWVLVFFSLANAFYTVTRTRKYRLFEASVEVQPMTPSARRVKVGTPPSSSSPMKFLTDIIAPETAESRAYPDKSADVWELSVWDPLPISLRLFCLFGPGHVLVYLLFLPLAPLDPRPSVTVFNTLVLQVLLSAQLLFLTSQFAQQAKDTAIIQKEVMHEYDTKFVHPRLHPLVRDVGTQFSEDEPSKSQQFVQTGTPTTLIRRSFQAHANPYARSAEHNDVQTTPTNIMKPQMFTPPTATRQPEPFMTAPSHRNSTVRKSLSQNYSSSGTSTNPTFSTNANTSTNFGGSMGIHTHNRSPLKKTSSLADFNAPEAPSPRNSREMAAFEQRNWGQQGSPLKRVENRKLTGSNLNLGGTSNPFVNVAKKQPSFERYPSRRQL